MADISKIKLNSITYAIKDETARANLGISETAANAIYLRLDGTNAPTAEYHWNIDFVSENGVFLNVGKESFINNHQLYFNDEATGRVLGFEVGAPINNIPIVTVVDGAGGAIMPLYGAYADDDNASGYFVTDTYLKSADYANGAGFIKKVGDTMSGSLSLNNNKITAVATPTDNLDAANKQYVDDKASDYLPLAGGNMTGNNSIISNIGQLEFKYRNADKRVILTANEDTFEIKGNLQITDVMIPTTAILKAASNGLIYTDNVIEPTDDNQYVQKAYVDTKANVVLKTWTSADVS